MNNVCIFHFFLENVAGLFSTTHFKHIFKERYLLMSLEPSRRLVSLKFILWEPIFFFFLQITQVSLIRFTSEAPSQNQVCVSLALQYTKHIPGQWNTTQRAFLPSLPCPGLPRKKGYENRLVSVLRCQALLIVAGYEGIKTAAFEGTKLLKQSHTANHHGTLRKTGYRTKI